MNKRILITQSNYIPWRGYFDNISKVDLFVIYDDMQFTKRDWRNRNFIITENGPEWLTIPVQVKGKFTQKINETMVSDIHWGRKHLNVLQQNYRKAPFYDKYIGEFEELYLDESLRNLSSINQRFLEKIMTLLNIRTTIIRSERFDLVDDRTQRLVDICKAMGADEYLTGPAAKAYMDEEKFLDAEIKVLYSDYSGYSNYLQQFNQADYSVSILDAIFNVGTNFEDILYGQKGKESEQGTF